MQCLLLRIAAFRVRPVVGEDDVVVEIGGGKISWEKPGSSAMALSNSLFAARKPSKTPWLRAGLCASA